MAVEAVRVQVPLLAPLKNKIGFHLPMLKRINVFYSGKVQGVGFRFTTEEIARGLGIAGWVRNLRDGRVELIAEAEESALRDFLSRIEQYFKNYIRDINVEWQVPTGEFKDFTIRFY